MEGDDKAGIATKLANANIILWSSSGHWAWWQQTIAREWHNLTPPAFIE